MSDVDLTIDIPALDAVAQAVRQLPQIAEDAQRFVLRPLGLRYLGALKAATPVGKGPAQGVRMVDSYTTEEAYSPFGSSFRIQNRHPALGYVLKGRGPVEAVRARALRFYDQNGEVIFRRRVGAAEANPFPDRVRAEMAGEVAAAGAEIAGEIRRRMAGAS